jgi:flagellar basal-body rod protein FlgB
VSLDLLATPEFSALRRTLGYHLLRHSLLTSNVANVETPGYRAADLSFDSFLDEAERMRTTQPKHLSDSDTEVSQMEVFDDSEASPGNDGNTVSLEREMAKISANTIRYNSSLEILSRRLAILRYAATDGSRR